MKSLKDEVLQRFYKQAKFDREHNEVKEIEQRVRSLVEEIAEYIGREDPLFKNFVIPSGSFYENLKVEGPDEFDFMICLEQLSERGVCVKKEIPLRPVPDPGYVDVKVASEAYRHRWQRYISRRGNLRPDVLLRTFKSLIKKAMVNRKRWPREKIAEHVDVELRKIPVTIKLTWNGTKYTNYEIAVDLTLCIKISEWPDDSDIRKRVKKEHPGYEVFQKAVQEGHHLVASTIGESGKPRPCWRLSFSVAEGIILKRICKDPKLMHNVALKVLKVLRKKFEEYLCLFEHPDGGSVSYRIKWAFHSYVLKTMFLHEWDCISARFVLDRRSARKANYGHFKEDPKECD